MQWKVGVKVSLILLSVLLDKGLVCIFIVLLAPFLLSPDKQNIKVAYNCIFLSAMPMIKHSIVLIGADV